MILCTRFDCFFFFKQKTAYEMRISDWSSDVCSSDLSAAHVTRIELVNNRLIPNAMEPRADNARYDKATGESTLFTTSQNPHLARLLLTANVLHVPEQKLRVIAPDVGGGVGFKLRTEENTAEHQSLTRISTAEV